MRRSEPVHRPLIVAHRGASASAPENTKSAFRRAIRDGSEGIEIDVRLAKDGVPVVIHDSTLTRTTGMDVRIANLTSTQLAAVDVGSWFSRRFPKIANPDFANETVPTLLETLELLRGFAGPIYVEIKPEEGEDINQLSNATAAVMNSSTLNEQLRVSSFDLSLLPRIRELCPGVRTGALFRPTMKNFLRKQKQIVERAEEFGADELLLHYALVSRSLVKKAGTKGLPVSVWTVNHPAWVTRAIKLGLDAIVTKNPSRLLSYRRQWERRNMPSV